MNETIIRTLGVTLGVCLLCSLFVSFTAVSLRDQQNTNKQTRKEYKNTTNITRFENIYIHLKKKTYDGRIRTGNPISSTALLTSSELVPVVPLGILRPASLANFSNRSLSLASSIASQEVPAISNSNPNSFKSGNLCCNGCERLIAV